MSTGWGDDPGLDEDVISAYLDRELDDATGARVAAWLARSSAARAVFDEVAATRDVLRSLPAVDGPAEFWVRVLAVSDGGAPDARSAAPVVPLAARRARVARRARWASAVAAAAAVVAIPVAAIPSSPRVEPPVATFRDVHAARASVTADAVSNLAPVALRLPGSP